MAMQKTIRLVGHQPEYLPWIGFFHKICMGDSYMIVDTVQYRKKYFQNRNRIRTKDGWIWIGVPVLTKGKFDQPIQEVRIDNSLPWRRKNWGSIEHAYAKSPYFPELSEPFRELYEKEWEWLTELNETALRLLFKHLDIDVPVVRASEKGVSGKKTDLIISMCRSMGASTYVSGRFGKEYLDQDTIREAGIELVFQDFKHPVYRQQFEPFIPEMSVIDLLFNEGPRAKEIVRGAV